MKKILGFVLSLILLAGMAFALVGCGDSSVSYTPPAVLQTVPGKEDPVFSSHEWRLFEEACADGYEGSFLDFLRETGVSVSDDTAGINCAFTSVVCVESVFGTGRKASGSAGSGVIWSLEKYTGTAYIVTNYHVIYGSDLNNNYGLARYIDVYLYGGYVSSRAIPATFCGGDMSLDIAVLKVTDSSVLKISYARAAETAETVAAGERVYALGNPDAQGFSVTGGVVSVPYETIEVMRADDKVYITLPEIRFDAAVNHGNSGGGLFNAEGKLVGIVNARDEGDDFIGYALPVSAVKPVVERALSQA